uniref:Uncharacterized protein n=1 Tax=Candidatus Kentrum sp. FM TaxID=2126340 RepID=A0A450SLQ8_9GAMM|nr:MAG: hypothetical protein BECKFM1743A_GA0114220_101141 [Candidatus Kentron sp. FM]VFJ54576.1 MAG: hypothetical protein BECKFM1743C_GA0114222_101411 [Candidatus Kentron sp. FM]VFK10366.1 MAG: hypothetical protein BECKFM1743B_GA0114221_101381 [Candidatus Kentron sp. FM]
MRRRREAVCPNSNEIRAFAKNIVSEALANKDSFLFHETSGYESGLMGYHRPVSRAMFSNCEMVEAIGTLLEPDISGIRKWDAVQWEAYCRAVSMTFQDHVEKKGVWKNSYDVFGSPFGVKGNIETAVSDLYKIDGVADSTWDDDIQTRLRVVVKFIKDAIAILDKKGVPEHLPLRIRERYGPTTTFYDYLVNMIFEVIFSASQVTSPIDQCWWIQHNTVWREFFNSLSPDGAAAKVVKFKVRRLIYDEIVDMKLFPNFKGARILGFCLNVMGVKVHDGDTFHDGRALQKAVLSWTKKNFAWLQSYNPRIAETCLMGTITYDAEHLRLVKTYLAGVEPEPYRDYFSVDPPPASEENRESLRENT